MKNGKILILLMAVIFILSGCIPSAYTKGVEAENYPEKELPVYDDAIIFEYEGDDEEVTIKYGTEDDVEDVMEFYQDYFEDEGIVLDEETEDKGEYSASGFFEEFLFEISVEEAKGDIEEKVFSSVAEVTIEFLTDEEIEERQGTNFEKEMIGFWQVMSMEYTGGEENVEDYGFAMDFMAGGKLDLYIFFTNEGMAGNDWSVTEDGMLQYYDPSMMENVDATVTFEMKGSDQYMYISEEDGSYILKKTDKDEFLAGADDFGMDIDPDDGGDVDVNVPTVSGELLLNQDGITVTLVDFEETYYSLDMNLLIENTNDKQVDVELQSLVVNGYSMQNSYLIGTVDANVKLNTEISLDTDELADCNIDEIATIDLVLELYDYDTWSTISVSDVIHIDTGSNFVQTYDTSGTTIINESGVVIKYKEFIQDADYYGPYALFYIENNTDTAINLSSDNVQINGFMISGYLYGNVAPGTCAIMRLEFYTSDLEDSGIDQIDDVKLSINVNYEDEWSYFIESDIITLPIK
ncbi:MAG: hypothetical protein JXN65_05585 [Clostridia bacterium]|nr:hypothetical protein [Clostridia bacterium]